MILKSKLTLNPRVSVFRHNNGIYLFDPITRTCASMNETMLSIVTKLDNADSLDELSNKGHKRLTKVIEQLHKLGILIEPETVSKVDGSETFDRRSSATNLAIFVTTKCNLRCIYCYAHGGDKEKTISKDTWRMAMDHFFSTISSGATHEKAIRKNLNLSIHGGGEPTMEFDILKNIVADFYKRARAAELEPTVSMGTNGTYGDSIHRWIIENNINVNVSLDGPLNIQNRLRPFRSGEPSYDVVVHNLQGLVKAGRYVSIRATITNETMETMEKTIELAKNLGLATVHFEPVSLTGRCANSTLSMPDAQQFADKFLKCFLMGLKSDVDVYYSGMRCFEHTQQRFCAACGQNFCVTPYGNITTCYEVLDSNDPATSEFFIGKVDPVQGRVVLDQVRIEQLKLRVAENMEACKSCFLRYQCAGDCPVKSFRYSNRDLYSPDPYRCRIADRINKQLIVWLADSVIEPRDVERTSIISFN
jgi:uncharacterized protein